MGEVGLLLYGITDQVYINLEEVKGLDEVHHLFTIEHKGLYGICSKIFLDDYGESSVEEKSQDISWITENACKFMNIMRLINEKSILIPMKFLTIFKDETRVHDIISQNEDLFRINLKRLTGCEEFSVKIYCDKERFKETCLIEEIEDFNKSIEGKPKGAAFFLKKKFESELESKIHQKMLVLANSIIETIEPYCEELKSNKLLAKELTGISDVMVANIAFLINRDKLNIFFGFMNDIKEKYLKQGFTIECSGPWPPYNFCN